MLLAQLKRRLKGAFLIEICPLSIVAIVVILFVLNSSHFCLLLQNHLANFNQTLYKVTMGRYLKCSNKWPSLFPRGDNNKIAKF